MAMRASGNRRLVCLLGLILLGSPMLALAALPRAASLTVCADQYLLGLADPAQIVAVSPDAADPNQSLFAAEAVRYPAHRGDSEELVALQAELVLTDRWLPLRTSERLERLGIRVIQLPLPDSWAEIAATTRTVAAALGRPAQGEARVAEMEAQLERLAAHRHLVRPPLAAYFLPDGGSAGAGTFIDAVLQAAGTRNLATTLGLQGWGTFKLEQLALAEPDLIVMGFFDQGGDTLRMAFARHPVFRHLLTRLPAIAVPDRYWICSGWFLAEAADYIAERLPVSENVP